MLTVCIDTNVWISGVVFSGKPAEVVTAAFARKFNLVLSQAILDELEKNLLNKFGFSRRNTKILLSRILQIADLYEPSGAIKVIPNHAMDNLVLETALLGKAKFLITGDRQHPLPLRAYRNLKIVDPATFLVQLKK